MWEYKGVNTLIPLAFFMVMVVGLVHLNIDR